MSVILNRTNKLNGKPVNLDQIINNPNQFQGVGGNNYNHFLNGNVSKSALANANAAANYISKYGPTTPATAFLVYPPGKGPTAADVKALGSVHFIGQVGNVYLYQKNQPPPKARGRHKK